MRKVAMNEVHAVKDINILKSIPSLLTKHHGEQMADIWEFGINVAIRISDTLNIKITDIEGNLVYETTSEGGTLLWDLTAFGRHKVASGVYLILIASEDGSETKVTKVMVVR